jgi:hypothetical protein
VNQDGQVDIVGALFNGRADEDLCPLLESQGEEVYAFNVNEVSDVQQQQQQATISNVKFRKKYTPKVAKDKLHCCHRQQPHGMDCQPKKKKFTCGRDTGFKRTTISTSKDGAGELHMIPTLQFTLTLCSMFWKLQLELFFLMHNNLSMLVVSMNSDVIIQGMLLQDVFAQDLI